MCVFALVLVVVIDIVRVCLCVDICVLLDVR